MCSTVAAAPAEGQGGGLPEAEAKLRENLETALLDAMDELREGIVDLNVDNGLLEARWKDVKKTRNQLLATFGVRVKPSPPPPPSPMPARSPAGPDRSHAGHDSDFALIPWKAKLVEECMKRSKRDSQKGDFIYENFEGADGGGYFSTVISQMGHLESSYTSKIAAPSKKAAENEVAMEAFRREFPHLFLAIVAQKITSGPVSQLQASSRQRKDEDVPEQHTAKNRLCSSLNFLLGRSATKDDMVFETVQFGTGGYCSTVTLPLYDLSQAWTGARADSKRGAEHAACEAALASLYPVIEPLEKMHKERKAKLNREKLAALQARRAAVAA